MCGQPKQRKWTVEEPWLSVIVRERDRRFVIDARAVEKLEPVATSAGEEAPDEVEPVELAGLLDLQGAREPSVRVTLRQPRVALLVEDIEAVVDLREARFSRLPTLTRVKRPAFRGVYDLDGDLLPALDLEGLFSETDHERS